MRVNLIGNLGNTNYVLAKGLRGLGVDARLYYQDNGFHSLPQADDPELADAALPHWLVPVERQRSSPFQQSDYVRPELLRELGQCDLLHANGPGLIWASRTGRPFVWQPYGSDLTYLPFYSRGLVFGRWRRITVPNVPYVLLPLKMRSAMRRASAILLGWHNALWRDGYAMFRRFNLESRIRRFHLALDSNRFSPVSEFERARLRATLLPDQIVRRLLIFHPTRQNFSARTPLGYKANDWLFRALGEYARGGGTFTLVVVENNLPDEIIARRIFFEYGINDRVHWIKPQPRHRLVDWYRAADITAESFWTGAIGAVPLESMACGTPVMMRLRTEPDSEDAEFFLHPGDLYDELPPIIRCASASEILSRLQTLAADPNALSALGNASRSWVERYASIAATCKRLLTIYDSVLSDRGQDPGRVTRSVAG